jgi:two-component system cell cycle response regulator DivK
MNADGTPVEGRILIVEDNAVNLLIVRTILRKNGHEPLVAKDGVEGAGMAREHHPALILMDIQMPRMDGVTAARQIWADPEMRKVPIIALTANATDKMRETCMAEGFERVMVKPLDIVELARIVNRFVRPAAEGGPEVHAKLA